LQPVGTPAAELAYHALAAGLAEPAFHWSLAAGDESMRVAAVRDAIVCYEQARQLLTEHVQGFELATTLPFPEIEHLYTYLGQAYEQQAEWGKAREVYMTMLAYAQNTHRSVMERSALDYLETLSAQ
jgi:hypothetical protein